MLELVEEGKEYKSPSGLKFKVLHLAKHGQDCSWPMSVRTNTNTQIQRLKIQKIRTLFFG